MMGTSGVNSPDILAKSSFLAVSTGYASLELAREYAIAMSDRWAVIGITWFSAADQ